MTEEAQKSNWLTKALEFVAGVRGILMLLGGLGAGGLVTGVFGDAGVTAAEADSISKKNDAPIVAQQKRQDTALMRIYFRQDVQMTEAQKTKADSLMRAALSNINYGGLPQ